MANLIIAIYVATASLALIILKLGSKAGAPASFSDGKLLLNLNPYTISGITFYGISFLVYMYLISKYDLGYIIPITTALVYIVIFTASFSIFKESFTVIKVIGIILIVLGLAFLNMKK